MIHLGLHLPGGASPVAVSSVRPLLDRTLALLVMALESVPGSRERQDVVSAMKRFAVSLQEDGESALDPGVADPLLTRCEEALRVAANERGLQQTEMRAVVAVLREVIAAVASANQALEVQVFDSARRMTALGACQDIHELKARLSTEVSRMKTLAIECRQHWQATVKGFEQRISELEGQLASARKEASLDPLTHLANRRAFDRLAGQWLTASHAPVLLAIVDLDNLKSLNDTGGHQCGDQALKRVATALRASVRARDLVARLGGDEFAILAEGLSPEQARTRLQQVVTELSATPLDEQHRYRVTITCGMATSIPGDSIDTLIARADRALYRGKRSGRNCVIVHD